MWEYARIIDAPTKKTLKFIHNPARFRKILGFSQRLKQKY
jgi:hypothetical protein